MGSASYPFLTLPALEVKFITATRAMQMTPKMRHGILRMPAGDSNTLPEKIARKSAGKLEMALVVDTEVRISVPAPRNAR